MYMMRHLLWQEDIMKTYEEKKRDLNEKIKEYTKQDICIAFSGGVDSSLLLMLAKECIQQYKNSGKFMQ